MQIQAKIPVKTVKFTRGLETEEGDEREDVVASVFTVTQRPSFRLKGGQALITFEEEKGMEKIKNNHYL